MEKTAGEIYAEMEEYENKLARINNKIERVVECLYV